MNPNNDNDDTNDNNDSTPIIQVDWEAVESAVGFEIPNESRAHFEHTGRYFDFEEGRQADDLPKAEKISENSGNMMNALREHSEWVHPDGDALPRRYISRQGASIGSYLRKFQSDDVNGSELVEPVRDDGEIEPGFDFADGLRDLVEAAKELDEQCSDWNDGHEDVSRPTVSVGSLGPDLLGNLHVHVSHTDREPIEALDTSELSVETTGVRSMYDRSVIKDVHYFALFRHERYLSTPWASKAYGKRTHRYLEACEENAGILDINTGKKEIKSQLRKAGIDFQKVGKIDISSLTVTNTPTIIDYEKGGQQRYAVEWTQRSGIDDYVVRSVVFDHYPKEKHLRTALAIEKGRKKLGRKIPVEFRCWECGRSMHWLDANGPGGDSLSLNERINQADRQYCGC
jgi:hypothetical protein